MNTVWKLFWLAALTLGSVGPALAQDEIVGTWQTEGNYARIQFFKQGGQYHGKLVWLQEPSDQAGKPLLDEKNPDPKLRSKPLLGSLQAMNFVAVGKNEWSKGRVYDAETGKSHSATFTMIAPNTLRFKITSGWFPYREDWTRLNQP